MDQLAAHLIDPATLAGRENGIRCGRQQKITYGCDEEGRLTRATNLDSNGSKITLKYNEEGRPTKTAEFDPDGRMLSEENYEFGPCPVRKSVRRWLNVMDWPRLLSRTVLSAER